jgi:hypothetical protein
MQGKKDEIMAGPGSIGLQYLLLAMAKTLVLSSVSMARTLMRISNCMVLCTVYLFNTHIPMSSYSL